MLFRKECFNHKRNQKRKQTTHKHPPARPHLRQPASYPGRHAGRHTGRQTGRHTYRHETYIHYITLYRLREITLDYIRLLVDITLHCRKDIFALHTFMHTCTWALPCIHCIHCIQCTNITYITLYHVRLHTIDTWHTPHALIIKHTMHPWCTPHTMHAMHR